MTLGIGFQCRDAIVICSDTLITYGESHQSYEHKIYRRSDRQLSVVFTYSGFPNTMTNFVSKFEDQLSGFPQKGKEVTAYGIQNLIESILQNSEFSEGLDLLCGIAVPNREMRLLKALSGKIGPCSTVWDCIGSGDSSLVKSLGSLLANSVNGYSLPQAELLGIYMIRQASRWVPGIGGEPDVFILHSDGRVVPSARIPSGVNARFEILERHFSPVAEAFFDSRIPEDELDRRIQVLARSLKENRVLL